MRYLPLAFVLAAGCFSPGRPDSLWATQTDSAAAIPNPVNRNNTLGTLAQSAAYDGDARSVRYALDRMEPSPKNDQVIAACVAQLASKDPDEARKIARRIGDEAQRKAALEKVGK